MELIQEGRSAWLKAPWGHRVKVIVLPSGAENKPQLLVGLGIAVVSLSAAYWLVKRANATPSRKRLGRGGSATKLDFED